MTVNVGVVGVGMIGQDHIRRLTRVLAGSAVVAVADADVARAKSVAENIPGAIAHATGEELINDNGVDAVVVTSWGPTHEPYVLASIAAGKPVFCEKPLAVDVEDARAFVAEARDRGAVNFPFASSLAVATLMDWIAQGAVGTASRITIEVAFATWPRSCCSTRALCLAAGLSTARLVEAKLAGMR